MSDINIYYIKTAVLFFLVIILIKYILKSTVKKKIGGSIGIFMMSIVYSALLFEQVSYEHKEMIPIATNEVEEWNEQIDSISHWLNSLDLTIPYRIRNSKGFSFESENRTKDRERIQPYMKDFVIYFLRQSKFYDIGKRNDSYLAYSFVRKTPQKAYYQILYYEREEPHVLYGDVISKKQETDIKNVGWVYRINKKCYLFSPISNKYDAFRFTN